MIAYIQETLHAYIPSELDATGEDEGQTVEEFDYVKKLLDDYCVASSIDHREDGVSFDIYPQKITLDDLAMNDLFYNVLSKYFSTSIEYANNGGKGCELAIRVLQNKPK